MPENVEYRAAVQILGWFHLIVGVLGFIFSIVVIGSIMACLDDPSILANLDPNIGKLVTKGVLVFALIYYCVNCILVVVDIWISKVLINAADMKTNVSDAILWAMKYIRGSAFLIVAEFLTSFCCWPRLMAAIGIILCAAIRGFLCYVVHKYIQSLKLISVPNVKFVTQNV